MQLDVIHPPYMRAYSTSMPDVYMELSEALEGTPRVKPWPIQV